MKRIKTTLMRVPLGFKLEVDKIAKQRNEATTKFLAKNVGLFARSEKFRKNPGGSLLDALLGK